MKQDEIIITEYNREKLFSSYELSEKLFCDLDTVSRAVAGDKDAFSVLFMQTYRHMYFVARKILHKDEDIYDALQIGYTKAYKYISRLSPAEMFVPWLKKTIENAAKDVYADVCAHRTISCDENEAEYSTSDCTEESERRADIQEVLLSMNSDQSEVLTLYFYDGMKLSEIAELLKRPQSTVRSQFRAAKKQLIKLLKAKGIDNSLYGGSVSAMIAVSLRSLIGTDLLSAAIAQRMLDEILNVGQEKKLHGAAFKLLERQRNKAVIRVASMLMALTVAVSGVTTVGMYIIGGRETADSFEMQSSAIETQSIGTSVDTLNNAELSSVNISSFAASSRDVISSDNVIASRQIVSSKADVSSVTKKSVSSVSADTSSGNGFIPDYRPGKANDSMRLPNNLSGYGWVDRQDEWVYFVGMTANTIEKIKKDGTGNTVLVKTTNGGVGELNVIGDWVYYREPWYGICRVRTDGAEQERLVGGCADNLRFVDNSLYYSASENGKYNVYRYDIKTRKKEILPLEKYSGGSFYITGKYILYYDIEAKLYAYNLSSRNIRYMCDLGKRADALWKLWIEGDYAYWRNSTGIVRLKYTAENSEPESIFKQDFRYIAFLNTFDHKLGLVQENGLLYLLDTRTYDFAETNLDLANVVRLDCGGFYNFEQGWVWSISKSNVWARWNYNGSGYEEY